MYFFSAEKYLFSLKINYSPEQYYEIVKKIHEPSA